MKYNANYDKILWKEEFSATLKKDKNVLLVPVLRVKFVV